MEQEPPRGPDRPLDPSPPNAPGLTPARVIAALAPHVTAARLQRMEAVLAQRTRHLSALLEHLYDPHNVAACARTADGLGVQDLHLVPHPPVLTPSRPPRDPAETMGDTGTPLGRAVSVRAEQWLTLREHPTLDAAVGSLRQAGYRIAVTALHPRARPLASLPLDAPVALVFGNERDGVSARALELADEVVTFPMRGFAQSFNVSVAFSLMMGQLRTRLEAERPQPTWGLSPTEREALLARWLRSTVHAADAILTRA